MNIKQYNLVRFVAIFGFAALFGAAMQRGAYWLVAAAFAVFCAIMMLLKKQVKGVLADERDYEIAGKASRYAMTVFVVVCAFVGVVLAAMKAHPVLSLVGSLFTFLGCTLMIIYSCFFVFMSKTYSIGRKVIMAISVLLILSFVAFAAVVSIAPFAQMAPVAEQPSIHAQ